MLIVDPPTLPPPRRLTPAEIAEIVDRFLADLERREVGRRSIASE